MARLSIRRSFLGDWPLARRLTLGFLVAALIAGTAAGLAGLTHAQVLATEASLYRKILNANQDLGVAENNLLLMDPTLHNALQAAQEGQASDLSVNRKSLQQMESQLNLALERYSTDALVSKQPEARQVLEAAGAPGLSGEQAQLFASAQRTWGFYQQAQDQVLALITNGAIAKAADYEHRQGEPTHSDAISAFNSLGQFSKQLAASVQAGVNALDAQDSLLSGLFAVLAIFAILLVGWLISRTILRPIHSLSQLTRQVTQGRFDSRAPVVSEDEIGSVTLAVNKMLDIIVGLLYETQGQRDLLTNRAEQLVGDLRGAGAGDLRVQASVGSDALGQLANTFNLTLNRFRRFITHT
jgi:methyl-accepting chemotaxis protein